MSGRPFTESRANKAALARLVRERWPNIMRGAKALGWKVGRKPFTLVRGRKAAV